MSILVLLSACGKGGGAAPSISSFEGSSGTIEAGSSTVLSWGVTGNFLEISVSSDPERESFLDLPASGEVTVSPAETTTYTLKVTRLQGEAVLATFTVTVTPAVTAPVITAFTAEPASIIAGDESKLSWSVTGEFDSIALSADPGSQLGDDLAATGTQDVEPAETTTYTLSVAYGSGQHVTATASVTVTPEPLLGEPPVISAFNVAPTSIIAGDDSTLSWNVSGVFTSITLTADPGSQLDSGLAASGTRQVQPGETTTYTLSVAYGSSQQVTETATVTVTPAVEPPDGELPAINVFNVAPTSITQGGNSTLSWNVSGVFTSITLSEGGDELGVDLSRGGTLTVKPAVTTTYTLTVVNPVGDPVTRSAMVTVIPRVVAPVITAFTAAPTSITAGETSTLSWNVSGDFTSITLSAGGYELGADLSREGTRVVTPAVTTTYTLSVTNSVGAPVTRSVTLTVVPRVVAPVITAFTAAPASITAGGESTLSWNVSGDFTSITLTSNPGTTIGSNLTRASEQAITPTVNTTYTLSVAHSGGQPITRAVTVTVTPVGDAPVITNFSHEIIPGSQVVLTWTATDADSYEIYSVDAGNVEYSQGVLAGTVTTATISIPASSRQMLRLRAISAAGNDERDQVLTNVVVSTRDYDPYHLLSYAPQASIPGTLRAVLAGAEAGSVIGFASDITEIDLHGVDLVQNGGSSSGWIDAHLILRNNIMISGPEGGRVTLKGISGGPSGSITFHSRMIYSQPDTNTHLENLVITGGDFIFLGGGIKNDGTMSISNTEISGNRAWTGGGGIHNTGKLTISDSTLEGNIAATTVAEAAAGGYDIRDITNDPDARITMTNDGGYGGGIWNTESGEITLIDTILSTNESAYSGAGIYNEDGVITMNGGALLSNKSDPIPYAHGADPVNYGGGIYTSGRFTMTNGNIADNTATSLGGGVYLQRDGIATLNGVTVKGNTAEYGGGIMHQYCADDANLILGSSSVTGNTANGSTANIGTQDSCAAASALRTFSIEREPGRYYPSDLIEEWMLGR